MIKFNESWLLQKDNNQHLISSYAIIEKSNETTKLKCKICNIYIEYSIKGLAAIRQHSDGKKHKSNYATKEGENQTKIVLDGKSNLMTAGLNLSFSHKVMKSELLHTINAIDKNHSFQSSMKDAENYKEMFPDSEIAKSFKINPKKAAYLTTEALGPYYREQFLDDIIKNDKPFSILFDETTNVQNRNELQIGIRYWDCDKIITRHLETFFIDNGKAKTIFDKILLSLSNANLSLKNVLMLGSDGPNVNKAVFRMLNDEILKIRAKPLINIGSCSLHVVHNAFEKALKNIGDDASDLIIKIFFWFKRSALRLADYTKIQTELKLKNHKFIKHIKTRWLTAGPAAERLIEQFSGVKKYFESFLPKIDKNISNNSLYKEIINLLKSKTIFLELNFLLDSATTFTQFTKNFQSEHPLIQSLFESMEKLIYVFLSKSIKIEKLNQFSLLHCDLVDLITLKNKIPLESLSYLSTKYGEVDLNTLAKNKFLLNCQEHYLTAASYIFKKIKPFIEVLHTFKYISPENIKHQDTNSAFQYLAKILPESILNSTRLFNELALLQLDFETLYEEGDFLNENVERFYLKVLFFFTIKNICFIFLILIFFNLGV